MSIISQHIQFTSEERALLNLGDVEITNMHHAARRGNATSRDRLFYWAYLTARNYYSLKAMEEQALSQDEAEELATEFFLLFEHNLAGMRRVTRFSRYILKRQLTRYMKAKRLHKRREPVRDPALLGNHYHDSTSTSRRPWESWTDKDFMQYHAVLSALRATDDKTREIIQLRLQDPPTKYEDIATILGRSETSIRMKVARFYASARNEYKLMSRGINLLLLATLWSYKVIADTRTITVQRGFRST